MSSTFQSDPINDISTATSTNKPKDRQRFLLEYLASAKTLDKSYPGYFEDVRAFTEEFLDYPERFVPTTFAIQTAYSEFVLHGLGLFSWPADVGTKYPIYANLIQSVSVYLDYRYSSTAGQECPVCVVCAEVLREGRWVHCESGGIAFSLYDWVEKKIT